MTSRLTFKLLFVDEIIHSPKHNKVAIDTSSVTNFVLIQTQVVHFYTKSGCFLCASTKSEEKMLGRYATLSRRDRSVIALF